MNRYQYGKIYKITSEHTNKIYVGSTCKKLLSQRLASHNDDYKKWKKGNKRYTTSFELFELGSVQITLLEACPCNTKDELLSKERHYIELHQDIIVNKQRPIVTNEENKEKMKQYNEYNKEHLTKQKKEYYEANKEHLTKQKKEYNEANKEQISKQKKEYRQANKEHIKNHDKEYSQANKDKIKKQKTQLIICECGRTITRQVKANHERTKKHIDLLAVKNL
jgi:hypothetical protein